MQSVVLKVLRSVSLITILLHITTSISSDEWQSYRGSPKMIGPAKFTHPPDPLLDQLDAALEKITTVYMQALFSGTHTASLDLRMRGLEIQLFDLLDALFKENRLSDYIKYEAEVTRQMILYNMLKKLFGYSAEDNERIK